MAKNGKGKAAKSSLKPGKKKAVILVSAIIALGILAFLAYYFGVFAKSCEDNSCLIDSANSCKSAQLAQNVEGSTFNLRTRGCFLIKTASSLNESEPPEIKELIEGKSMTCKFDKGQFDARWVNTLALGIEACEGELRDSLLELSVVIY